MRTSGAAIVDVGGESTRPKGATYGAGAPEISSEGELDRVLPVLSYLRRRLPSLPLSVDTRRAEVARAALDAGADIVNVVTGLDIPDELLELVASRGAASSSTIAEAHPRPPSKNPLSRGRHTK